MKVYKAKVKYNGGHYFAGETVKGTKVRQSEDEWFLFDDEPIYVFPFYGEGRDEWVAIDVDTLEEIEIDKEDW